MPQFHLLGCGTGAQQAPATKSAVRGPSRLAHASDTCQRLGADLESLRIDLIGSDLGGLQAGNKNLRTRVLIFRGLRPVGVGFDSRVRVT